MYTNLIVISLILSFFTTIGDASSWDAQRYIDINEVRSGMDAYCLTVYQGTAIERFDLDVVDVVYDFQPNLDVILVKGTDERFVHTGPVAGCSGSPVYIDGRLAGALAFGWPLSKDALYGVTPIRAMLGIGQGQGRRVFVSDPVGQAGHAGWWGKLSLDWRKPLDVNRIGMAILQRRTDNVEPNGRLLQCPLLFSGVNAGAQESLEAVFAPYGLMAVPGVGVVPATPASAQKTVFNPGSVMMVPLVDGDVRMAVLGTVTEVVGDRIYGFGHSFLGQGALELPLSTGHVHTIVSNLSESFKLGSLGEMVGVLTDDEPMGVSGILKGHARTIPLTLHLQYSQSALEQEFTCRLARHRLLTLELVRAVLEAVPASCGTLPPDHTLTYEVCISLDQDRVIHMQNVSANSGLNELLAEVLGSVALILHNPFSIAEIENLHVDMKFTPRNSMASVAAVKVPDRRVKAGESVDVTVVLEGFRTVRRVQQFSMQIPKDTQPGDYELIVGGFSDYQQFLRRRVPYRLMADSMPSLIEALNYALSVPRNQLYCLLGLQRDGIALERHELPNLPGTRVLVLEGAKKTVTMTPYQPWIEQRIEVDAVVVNGQRIRIKVVE